MTQAFMGLFAAIHVGGIACLAVLLLRPSLRTRFERRCLRQGTAIDLAFVRGVTCAILCLYVWTEDLPSHARLSPSFYRPIGFMSYFGQATLDELFSSAGRLRVVSLGVLLLLGLAGVGLCARLTLPLAALSYGFLAGLLRAHGKLFHEGYLAWYVLIVLSFLPAARAGSIDALLGRWWRSRRSRGPLQTPDPGAYAWMLWACQAAAAVPYLQLSLSKLWDGGLYWFDGRSIRNFMLVDDLNLAQWDLDLGLRFYQAPTLLFTLLGLFGLVAETAYPLALVVPRLWLIAPAAVILVHLGVWFWQDALFLDAILLPAIFFVPSRWRSTRP